MYNPMTCQGGSWTTQATSWIAGGDCLKIRIGFVLLFFIMAIVRKWGGEEMGINFSLIGSLALGYLSYLIVAILFGNFPVSFIVGLAGGLIGGYGSGFIGFGGEGDYE